MVNEEEITNEELAEEDITEEGYPELDELFGRGEEEEDEEEEGCYGEIAKAVTVIAQPIETFVEVGAMEDESGDFKPHCKFSIKRNLSDDVDEFEFIVSDFEELLGKVERTIKRFREE